MRSGRRGAQRSCSRTVVGPRADMRTSIGAGAAHTAAVMAGAIGWRPRAPPAVVDGSIAPSGGFTVAQQSGGHHELAGGGVQQQSSPAATMRQATSSGAAAAPRNASSATIATSRRTTQQWQNSAPSSNMQP